MNEVLFDIGRTLGERRLFRDGDIRDGELLVAEPSYRNPQGHKNSPLIAAAPELLAALELAVELLAWELIYPNTNGAIRQSSPVNHKQLFETAKAAIAKARGVFSLFGLVVIGCAL